MNEDLKQLFDMFFGAYSYFTEKTGSAEIGIKLAREFQVAMFAGNIIGSKGASNSEALKWFLDNKEW